MSVFRAPARVQFWRILSGATFCRVVLGLSRVVLCCCSWSAYLVMTRRYGSRRVEVCALSKLLFYDKVMVSTIEQNSYCIPPDSNVLFVWISKGTWAVKLRFYTNGHKMAMITGIQLLLLFFCDVISSCSLLEQHTHTCLTALCPGLPG